MDSPLATTAVVGIGTTGFGKFENESLATLCNRAVSAALDDAGLTRSQIDGLIVQIGSPRGLDYDVVAGQLNFNVRFSSQTWAHGRWCATVLTHAALALNEGLCDYAVCLATFKNSLFTRHGTPGYPGSSEGVREGNGPHAESPQVGMAAPAAGAAMALRRYLDHYGIDREKLGAIPIAQRKWASRNPAASFTKPLTQDDYEASRFVIEPLRLFDCSFPVDMSTAVILTTAERAADLRERPVWLRGYQGVAAGPNEFCFGAPGLGINEAEVFDYKPLGATDHVYRRAGVGPSDVGAFYCYDGFSSQVVYTLERFGFCPPGEGVEWAQGGRIEPGGELPTNTSGGHLSEGHSNGWGQTMEIVRQLRGAAGSRQVPKIEHALWATTLGDAILYGRERS